MSNVVYLNVPGPRERRAARSGALIRSFAAHRRGPEDVFWLKENAELLNILERIKEERGQTIIIVEQSLNVALSVSDRAVFMEKGQVRFEGPASELAERDDLARAVFLGQEGG